MCRKGAISERKGKTYEEIFGLEKAMFLKELRRKQMSGKKHPNYGNKWTGKGWKHKKETIEKMKKSHPVNCGKREEYCRNIKERYKDEKYMKKFKKSISGRKHTKESIDKMKKNSVWKNKKIPKEIREKIRNTLKGKYTGSKNPFFGKCHTKETKIKIRRTLQKYILNNGKKGLPLTPNIGKHETKILNDIENKKGIFIIRQYPVSTYFIDGYDKNNNIAYEIDEKHHENMIEQDKERENYIKNILKCEFVRIKPEEYFDEVV